MAIKLAIIYGGWSNEGEISLVSGKFVYESIIENDKNGKYDVCLIKVEKNIANLVSEIERFKPDIVFNALHGVGGEDGVIQSLMDIMEVKYTHSGVAASALAMDKFFANNIFEKNGLLVPKYSCHTVNEIKFLNQTNFPFVLKPRAGGSSRGVFIISSGQDLKNALVNYDPSDSVIIQEYIAGREIQVGVLDGKALGVIEIKHKAQFFDYYSKYTPGAAEHIIPPSLPDELLAAFSEKGALAAKSVGCGEVARVDFIYNDNEEAPKLYILEVNSQPGMTGTSLFPEIAAYAGISYYELIEKIIEIGFKKYY